jgi:acetylornithine deacetylase
VLISESSVPEVAKTLKAIVEDINANVEKLDTRGPVSKYVVPEDGIRGRSVMNLYTFSFVWTCFGFHMSLNDMMYMCVCIYIYIYLT